MKYESNSDQSKGCRFNRFLFIIWVDQIQYCSIILSSLNLWVFGLMSQWQISKNRNVHKHLVASDCDLSLLTQNTSRKFPLIYTLTRAEIIRSCLKMTCVNISLIKDVNLHTLLLCNQQKCRTRQKHSSLICQNDKFVINKIIQ